MKSRSMSMIVLLGFGLMGFPLLAAADQGEQATQAVPGTVNYVEGGVYLNGAQLNPKDIGNTTLEPGQQISTGKGKAEVLLTPGVFLRLDDNSSAKMVSPDLGLTQVELDKGRAGIEVDEIHNLNDLQLIDDNVTTRLDKCGYYEFDAKNPEALVFKGEAHVEVGDGKWKEIKSHHEFALNEGGALLSEKPANFNEKDAMDELYNWSSLRSEYMAEANGQMATEYTGPYAGPGWYWDPWTFGYAYLGWGPFASPFGWGFYPYGWAYYPTYGGYWGHGYYGGHYLHDPHPGYVAHGTVHSGDFAHFHNGAGYEGFHNTNGGGGFEGFHAGGGFAGGRR